MEIRINDNYNINDEGIYIIPRHSKEFVSRTPYKSKKNLDMYIENYFNNSKNKKCIESFVSFFGGLLVTDKREKNLQRLGYCIKIQDIVGYIYYMNDNYCVVKIAKNYRYKELLKSRKFVIETDMVMKDDNTAETLYFILIEDIEGV